jgi:DNA-binding MarR family transcriptional regulator
MSIAAPRFSHHDPGTASEAFTDLALEVFRVNGRLLAAGDRLAAPAGLTSARWQVLGAVEAAPLTVAGIARAMGLTRQSVQRIADLLAAEGVIAFHDNPAHRRAKLVAPTRRGRKVLAAINRLQADWAHRVSDAMTAGELEAAVTVLRHIRARLEGDVAEGAAGNDEDS